MTTATTPQSERADKIVGSTIGGRYRIEKRLGEGGMGAVYLAEHTLMHKRVAIKVLHAEMSKMDEVVARFEREAMAAGNIEHPNVASATDFGKLDDGSFFLVLELIEGRSLREQISQGRIDARRVARIVRQIASALSRAHGLGIVHRDLKPENVMLVSRDGDEDFVKVLDFGIAKVPVGDIAPKSAAAGQAQNQALTQLGMIYGTPEYMPPEQALGQEVDRRADLYALGVMAYEMLAGKRPFDDDSKVKLLGMHITAPVPPLPADAQVPPELYALVMKLLAKDCNERVQEAREVIDVLDAAFAWSGASGADGGLGSSAMSGPHAVAPPATSRPSLPGADGRKHKGVAPTVIALEAQAKTIASDVTRILPPKVLFATIGVIALATFITIVTLVVKGGTSDSTPAGSSSTTSSAAAEKKPSHFDRDLRKAEAELGAGHWDAAIAQARTLLAEAPNRPEPMRLIFQAEAGKGDTRAALADATPWLAVDPAAQNDAQLREVVRSALGTREEEGPAFALLESGKMGSSGADMLYDLAYTAGQPPPVQTHARHALSHPDVMKHASRELQIAIDLRNATGCEAKKQLLDTAAAEGDARTLAIFDSYASTGGCGFLGTRDCWACMHKDGSLTSAMSKLRARVSP